MCGTRVMKQMLHHMVFGFESPGAQLVSFRVAVQPLVVLEEHVFCSLQLRGWKGIASIAAEHAIKASVADSILM